MMVALTDTPAWRLLTALVGGGVAIRPSLSPQLQGFANSHGAVPKSLDCWDTRPRVRKPLGWR